LPENPLLESAFLRPNRLAEETLIVNDLKLEQNTQDVLILFRIETNRPQMDSCTRPKWKENRSRLDTTSPALDA
jgi:hypothetical protein